MSNIKHPLHYTVHISRTFQKATKFRLTFFLSLFLKCNLVLIWSTIKYIRTHGYTIERFMFNWTQLVSNTKKSLIGRVFHTRKFYPYTHKNILKSCKLNLIIKIRETYLNINFRLVFYGVNLLHTRAKHFDLLYRNDPETLPFWNMTRWGKHLNLCTQQHRFFRNCLWLYQAYWSRLTGWKCFNEQ